MDDHEPRADSAKIPEEAISNGDMIASKRGGGRFVERLAKDNSSSFASRPNSIVCVAKSRGHFTDRRWIRAPKLVGKCIAECFLVSGERLATFYRGSQRIEVPSHSLYLCSRFISSREHGLTFRVAAAPSEPCRVRDIYRIVPHISIEVHLVLIADWIHLQEPSNPWVIATRLVVPQRRVPQADLPRVAEPRATVETIAGVRLAIRRIGAGDCDGVEVYGLVDETFGGPVPDAVWITLDEREKGSIPSDLIIVGDSGDGGYYCIQHGEDGPVHLVAPNGRSEAVAADFGAYLLSRLDQ